MGEGEIRGGGRGEIRGGGRGEIRGAGWGEVVCNINEMKFGKKLICAEGIVDKANLLLTFTTYF